jgi:hypothetical protein
MYNLDAAHAISAAMIWYGGIRFVESLLVDPFGEMDSDSITYFFGDAGAQIGFDGQLMSSVAERHE